MVEGPAASGGAGRVSRAVALLVLALGLVLQVWLWQRGRLILERAPSGAVELCGVEKYDDPAFTGDQVHLLTPAVERASGGELLPYSKRMSGGGVVPGSLLQVLIGEPLKLVFDYRAASAVLLLFHLLAGWLVWRAGETAGGAPFAALLFALFWLSPWRLYHGGFLWEPAYVLLPAALHLWAHGRLFERASPGPSGLLALSLVIAPQLHASAIILLLVTAWLAVRRRVHLHLPGFAVGLAVGALPLAPTALALIGGDLDLVDEDHPTDSGWDPVKVLYRLPRALGYWIRVGSLDVGRRYRQTSFFQHETPTASSVAAFALSILAVLSALVVAYVTWRWLRGRLSRMRPGTFAQSYAVAGFVAVLASAAISPVTLQGWHVVIALPALLLPVAAWAEEHLARPRPAPLVSVAAAMVAAAQVACVVLLGLGHPMYAEPAGTRCVTIASPGGEPALVLYDVTLLEGPERPPRANQVLVLRGGRLARVGPVGEVQIPANAEVLELAGRHVVPAPGQTRDQASLEPGAAADLWVLRRRPSFDARDRDHLELKIQDGEPLDPINP